MNGMIQISAYKLCFLASLLAFSHQLELKVSYHVVEIFGQDVKEEFNEGHNIVRRAAGVGSSNGSSVGLIQSSSSISHPKMSVMPWKSIIPHQPKDVIGISTSSQHINVTSMSPMMMSIYVPTKLVNTTIAPNNTVTTPLFTKQPTITHISPSSTPYSTPNTTSRSIHTTMPPTTGMKNISETNSSEDNHKYYISKYYSLGANFWFNLDADAGTPKLHAVNLSKNLKFSESIDTSFEFPYYGHLIDYVTLTNKGYVFLGPRIHKFNASAQYVAPLMADFGPDLHEKTAIHYVDTGQRFTVQWSNMKLRNQESAGEFSFQCSIFKNGTIVFAYKEIPTDVTKLKGEFYVRVGLSDAYRTDVYVRGRIVHEGKTYLGIHYITYYLYHKVKLPKRNVKSGSAFVIIPEPNCVTFKSCPSCVSGTKVFKCQWCPKLNRCSDGFDRHRDEWDRAGCSKNSRKKAVPATCISQRKQTRKVMSTCHALGRGVSVTSGERSVSHRCPPKVKAGKKGSIGDGEIFLIVFILFLVVAVVCWLYYGYRHPQSKLGMCLIEYGNPRKWCRKSGEERSRSSGGRITFKTMSFESNA